MMLMFTFYVCYRTASYKHVVPHDRIKDRDDLNTLGMGGHKCVSFTYWA
jgi:hypothetical protein